MYEVESGDQAPGTVIQVVEAGYVIADRLLRPAMVGIAKARAGAEAAAPEGAAEGGREGGAAS